MVKKTYQQTIDMQYRINTPRNCHQCYYHNLCRCVSISCVISHVCFCPPDLKLLNHALLPTTSIGYRMLHRHALSNLSTCSTWCSHLEKMNKVTKSKEIHCHPGGDWNTSPTSWGWGGGSVNFRFTKPALAMLQETVKSRFVSWSCKKSTLRRVLPRCAAGWFRVTVFRPFFTVVPLDMRGLPWGYFQASQFSMFRCSML